MSIAADKSPAKLKIRCPTCHQKLDVTDLAPFDKVECPSCRQDIVIPKRFGGFLLEEMIGTGGTGTVYRAVDLTLDREVAIKIVSDQRMTRPERIEPFLAEARKIALLNHPHIIPIYSWGEEGGQPYLVMQYMEGQSLAWKMGKTGKEILPDQAVAMFLGVAKGLEAAYRHGILHHNIKPANILVDADGNPKIGDFGLALAMWDSRVTPEQNLATCFTCTRYLSPERLVKGMQDVRGDIFSLGATFYHVLTGRPPFEEGAGIRETVEKRLIKTPVAPATLRDEIPAPLSDFIMRLLATPPESRPSTYSEIISTLEGMKKSAKPKRMLNKKKTMETAIVFRKPATAERPAPANLPARKNRWRRPLFWSIPVLLILLILGVLLIGVGRDSLARFFGRTTAPAPVLNEEPTTEKTGQIFAVPPALDENADDAWGSLAPAPAVGDALAKALDIAPGSDETSSEVTDSATMPAADEVIPNATDTAASGPDKIPPEIADIVKTTTTDKEIAPEALKPMAILDPRLTANRPRPADLDFLQVQQKLRDYLKKVPLTNQAVEKERVLELSVLRDYLVKLMKFIPYDDEKKGVVLRDGKVLRGSVLANEHELAVRPKTGKYVKLKWEDLTLEQYLVFFDFYIDLRLNRSDPNSRSGGLIQRQKEAGADCFRLALLADWYGKPDRAAEYLRKSLEYDPSAKEKVTRFFPKVPTATSAIPAE